MLKFIFIFCTLVLLTRSSVQAFQAPCTSDNDSEMYADSSDCTQFTQCSHGVPNLQACPSALHYNSKMGYCDWPQSAGCKAEVGDEEITTVSSTTTTVTPAPVTTQSPQQCPVKSYKIICYFTNWAWYRLPPGNFKPENIDPSLCTHVVYAFAILDNSTYEITPYDTWADLDNGFYKQITDLKNKCVTPIIGIGGWNDSVFPKYSIMLNDPSKRASFVQSAVTFCQTYGFQGMDLDIEYPTAPLNEIENGNIQDKDGFANLVRELRQAFALYGFFLSAAVSANPLISERAYDIAALTENLDWIGVMTYDYHGHWDKKTGHIAPLYDDNGLSCNSSIQWWINSGVPSSKLMLGVATYGQTFTMDDPSNCSIDGVPAGPGLAGNYTQQNGILSNYEILDCLKTNPTFYPSTDKVGPYFCSGNQLVTYDDCPMINRKAAYAKENELGGYIVWSLPMDNFQNGDYDSLRCLNECAYS